MALIFSPSFVSNGTFSTSKKDSVSWNTNLKGKCQRKVWIVEDGPVIKHLQVSIEKVELQCYV